MKSGIQWEHLTKSHFKQMNKCRKLQRCWVVMGFFFLHQLLYRMFWAGLTSGFHDAGTKEPPPWEDVLSSFSFFCVEKKT